MESRRYRRSNGQVVEIECSLQAGGLDVVDVVHRFRNSHRRVERIVVDIEESMEKLSILSSSYWL